MNVDGTQNAPDDEEYQSILNAVMETPRGRWFIEEFKSRNRTADTNELLAAINSLKSATIEEPSATVSILRRELQEMSSTIQQTRAAVASIKPEDADDNRIMAATEELDAIVSATERATSEILTGAERIQEITEKLREDKADEDLCDEIESHATAIFMACSFQDITGQRTTRVVQVLKYLEHRVNYMIELWGDEEGQSSCEPPELIEFEDARPDAHLLNGPQSEDKAISQGAVDAMMNEFSESPAPPPTTPSTNEEAAVCGKHVDLDDMEFAPAPEAADCEQDDIDTLFD